MIKKVYKFVKETGKNIVKAVKEMPMKVTEDILGITKERNALNSAGFKRYKQEHPKEAIKYERSLKTKINYLKGK